MSISVRVSSGPAQVSLRRSAIRTPPNSGLRKDQNGRANPQKSRHPTHQFSKLFYLPSALCQFKFQYLDSIPAIKTAILHVPHTGWL